MIEISSSAVRPCYPHIFTRGDLSIKLVALALSFDNKVAILNYRQSLGGFGIRELERIRDENLVVCI